MPKCGSSTPLAIHLQELAATNGLASLLRWRAERGSRRCQQGWFPCLLSCPPWHAQNKGMSLLEKCHFLSAKLYHSRFPWKKACEAVMPFSLKRRSIAFAGHTGGDKGTERKSKKVTVATMSATFNKWKKKLKRSKGDEVSSDRQRT